MCRDFLGPRSRTQCTTTEICFVTTFDGGYPPSMHEGLRYAGLPVGTADDWNAWLSGVVRRAVVKKFNDGNTLHEWRDSSRLGICVYADPSREIRCVTPYYEGRTTASSSARSGPGRCSSIAGTRMVDYESHICILVSAPWLPPKSALTARVGCNR